MKPNDWMGLIGIIGLVLALAAYARWETIVERLVLNALKYTLWGVFGIVLVLGCLAYPLGFLVGIGAWYVIEMHNKLERIAQAAERKDK